MENPIKMDDLGVPMFLETPIESGAPVKYQTTIPWNSQLKIHKTRVVFFIP